MVKSTADGPAISTNLWVWKVWGRRPTQILYYISTSVQLSKNRHQRSILHFSSSSCFLTEGLTLDFVLHLSQKWGGCGMHPFPCSPKARTMTLHLPGLQTEVLLMQENKAVVLEILCQWGVCVPWAPQLRADVQTTSPDWKVRLLLWIKRRENSALHQRCRKLNESFISSPFSSGELVMFFYNTQSPLLPLLAGRKERNSQLNIWYGGAVVFLSLCGSISNSHMLIFTFSFQCWVVHTLIVKWLLCNSVMEMLPASAPLALELRKRGQPKLDNFPLNLFSF